MNIRVMTIADYEGVYALWLSCSGMGLNDKDDSREGIERFLLRNPDTCFVAEEGGRIVGSIMVGHDGRRGHIHHTAVSPEHRKAGIAAAMVERALAALGAEGITKVALLVKADNASGNAFWEHYGFGAREDIIYRDYPLAELVRLDT